MSGASERHADRLSAQLEEMILVREFEQRVADLFEDNELPGFVHLCVGQEAVVQNGPASYIAQVVEEEAFYHLEAPPTVVGVDDTPIPFTPELAAAVVPDADDVEDAIRNLPRL